MWWSCWFSFRAASYSVCTDVTGWTFLNQFLKQIYIKLFLTPDLDDYLYLCLQFVFIFLWLFMGLFVDKWHLKHYVPLHLNLLYKKVTTIIVIIIIIIIMNIVGALVAVGPWLTARLLHMSDSFICAQARLYVCVCVFALYIWTATFMQRWSLKFCAADLTCKE